MKKYSITTLLAAAIFLTACGGGGSDSSVSTNSNTNTSTNTYDTASTSGPSAATDAEIINLLAIANSCTATNASCGLIVRWNGISNAAPVINVYIPAPSNDVETALADKARTAIADINRKTSNRTVLTEVSQEPVSGGYMRVSYNTSYVPQGGNPASYCANVSTGPSIGTPIQGDPSTFDLNNVVAWINLGNNSCTVHQDIVTHEFGHALGLGWHFDGFGNGDAIDSKFWDVLTTLYANPVGTPYLNATVQRTVL